MDPHRTSRATRNAHRHPRVSIPFRRDQGLCLVGQRRLREKSWSDAGKLALTLAPRPVFLPFICTSSGRGIPESFHDYSTRISLADAYLPFQRSLCLSRNAPRTYDKDSIFTRDSSFEADLE
jgi:hypothetical protein